MQMHDRKIYNRRKYQTPNKLIQVTKLNQFETPFRKCVSHEFPIHNCFRELGRHSSPITKTNT